MHQYCRFNYTFFIDSAQIIEAHEMSTSYTAMFSAAENDPMRGEERLTSFAVLRELDQEAEGKGDGGEASAGGHDGKAGVEAHWSEITCPVHVYTRQAQGRDLHKGPVGNRTSEQ